MNEPGQDGQAKTCPTRLNRRQFLAAGAVSAGLLQAVPPSLAIAHCKAPSNAPETIPEEARRLTRAAIGALGGMGRFVSKGNLVWVKPNIAWDRRPEQAACTNPDVVAAIVEMCYQAGAAKVVVGDNPCHPPERTFPRSGIQQAAERAGARCPFMDERKFRTMSLNGARVLTKWKLYAELVEADCLINVPIAKQHSLAKAVLGMKNLMGAAGGDRNRFHQDIANTVTDLAVFLKPRLVVLDAVRVLTANGPTGGNLSDVKRKDLVAAGVDQVAVDALGATILGYRPADIPYLVEGQSRRLGTMDFQSLAPVRLEI
jgi:uncharacterized protein (DUF362 family)